MLVVAAAAVLCVDIATKFATTAALADRRIDLPGPLDLRLAHNPGVAFGLGTRSPTWLVLLVTGAVVVGMAVAAWRGVFASSLAAGVVIGGALANLIDRLEGGTVIDMLYTGWWPTFNVADIAVVCGAVALVVAQLRDGPTEPESV